MIDTNTAAVILGVHPERVRQLCKSGVLPAVRLNTDTRSSWLIHPDHLFLPDVCKRRPVGRQKKVKA